jgi:hypothetical protein
MQYDDPSRKILGSSVQLNKRSRLLIQEANLSARLDNIDNYPGIKPWIGDPDKARVLASDYVGLQRLHENPSEKSVSRERQHVKVSWSL